MLDLRRLRILREFASRGTVTDTAESLHLSRSSVSQQLAQLEREAHTKLFQRVGRNLRLTDAGWTLVRHAEILLEQSERAEADLESMQNEVRGTVRVGIFQTAGILVLPQILLELEAQYPHLVVHITHLDPERALPALQTGDIDLMIGQSYDLAPQRLPEGITRRLLARESVRLAVPDGHPTLSVPGPVSLEALAGDVWAAGGAHTGFGDLTFRLCSKVGGFAPDIRYRSSDFSVLLALVGNGLCVALMPDVVAQVQSTVTMKGIREGPFGREIFSATREVNAGRPSVETFLAATRRAFQSLGDTPGPAT